MRFSFIGLIGLALVGCNMDYGGGTGGGGGSTPTDGTPSSSGGSGSSSGSSSGSTNEPGASSSSGGSTSSDAGTSGKGTASSSSSGSSSGGGSNSGSGSSSGSGISSGSGSSSGGGAESTPTWSSLYQSYFATGTIGHCGDCHSSVTDAKSLYTFVGSYLSGSSSTLATLFSWNGGSMPPSGPTSEPQATSEIEAWIAAGAKDD